MLDSNGEILCVSGVNNDMYCLTSDDGREVWDDIGDSQIVSQPQMWETADRSVVYVIESANGRVRQHDLYTGERYWDFSCADINGLQVCQDAVEADFAIAPSGNAIYFGDIFGRIVSLEIAAFATDAPTISPTGDATPTPTNSPSTVSNPDQDPAVTIPVDTGDEDDGDSPPTSDMVDNGADSVNAQAQANQEESKNTGLYIGAVIGGLCALLVPFVVYSLMRGGRNKPRKGEEMMVEIIDDCPEGDSSEDDTEDNDIEYETKESGSNGIEIEYLGSKAIHGASTPRRKKKKKRKKNHLLPQTPQTTLTLEAIEELPEELSPGGTPDTEDDSAIVWSDNEDIEKGFEAVDLGRKFEQVADSEESGEDSSDSSESSTDEDHHIATGDVVVANGSNHLELAIGNINNSNLTPLHPEDERSASEGSSPFDEEVPSPPPTTVGSSTSKWSWGSLLKMGTVQSTPKENTSLPVQDKQNFVLRPIKREDSHSKVSAEDVQSVVSDEVSHRAETPPASNQKKTDRANDYEPDREMDRSTSPDLDAPLDETVPSGPAKSVSPAPTKQQIARETKHVEEEKKENEEVFSRPQTPAERSACPMSPGSLLSSTDGFSPRTPSTNMSPTSRSSNILSPQDSHSDDSSTDDSLFTSATGMTGEKKREVQNLSPLSTNLFDNDIDHRSRKRSDIPHDELSEILGQPNMGTPTKSLDEHKFRYLEEDTPEDEVTIAPGFQYMTNQKDDNKSSKYGRSVRSRKDPTTFKEGNQNSRASASPGSESPITSIYNQLAALGQKQAEEKKKHSFKRRSKRNAREEPDEEEADAQEEPDTWGSFLQELADAEAQFFAPSSNQTSLLKMSDSQDTEDSEVARINGVL